jgi:hypothetical protein
LASWSARLAMLSGQQCKSSVHLCRVSDSLHLFGHLMTALFNVNFSSL